MPPDRLLNTVLSLYPTVHDATKTDQILGSTTTLLTTLSNPLNLGVLTSQLLTAPAIWDLRSPAGGLSLRACLRVMSVYNTAAMRVRQHQLDASRGDRGPPLGGGLSCEAWARGVAAGADARSARWKHLLVLTGVLLGMEGEERQSLPRHLRNTLEEAVVSAANLALEQEREGTPALGTAAVVLALCYAFPLLSEWHRGMLNSDALLPAIVWAITSQEGFREGTFFVGINHDLRQIGGQLVWAPASPSARILIVMQATPLMGSMGPAARLAGFAVERARSPQVVLEAQDRLLVFSRTMLEAWRASKVSEVDSADERLRLSPDTLRDTWPALWQVLQKALYSIVMVLQAIVGRSLVDGHLRNDMTAPRVAAVSLHILRNLFFISSRNGIGSFQAYTFAYLASLDTLARFPSACASFLTETVSATPGAIPPSALGRNLDLFHLNVSEHLPLGISMDACDRLIVQPALVYLSHVGAPSLSLVELFEAAHSALLAVMSCPHNSVLTAKLVPFYVDKLFSSFPSQISTRQFRLAFKTVMQIVSPPFPISAMHPELGETLLEMVHFRVASASTALLSSGPETLTSQQPGMPPAPPEPLSEQSSLVLTLIDALPFLPLPIVDEWLTLTAKALNMIREPVLREPVRRRFWDVLVSGEMDVERAAMGVAWWGSRGGRELVLYGGGTIDVPMMSGAIVDEDMGSRL